MDGFGEFGRRLSLAELKRQAAEGPVAVFNISSYGSDAILLTRRGIRSLELPRLTLKTTAEKFKILLRAQPGWPDVQEPGQGMSDVLTWLYEAATGPVLDALGLGPVHEDDERSGLGSGGSRPACSPCFRCTRRATTPQVAGRCSIAWCRPTRRA